MKGWETIAQFLKEYGVTTTFYQDTALPLTIKRAEEVGVKCVLARTEFGAAYMADGYARVSGRPGVCMGQGIGAYNYAAGINDAYMGCSPVVCLTGRKPNSVNNKNTYQDTDPRMAYEAITKLNAEVLCKEQLPHLMRQSFKEAVRGKPRPVHLTLDGTCSLEIETLDIDEPFVCPSQYGTYPPFRPKADEKAVEEAADEIKKAKKPIIVAGRGCLISQAHDALKKFAEKTDIPVATTCDGKTIIDEADPLWAGVPGDYGMAGTNKALMQADLVIFIGSQTGDQATLFWTAPPITTRAIQIDIDYAELGRNYPNNLGLLGDARTVIEQLTDAVTKMEHPEWRQEVADCIQPTFADHEMLWNKTDGIINPGYLCGQVSKALPDNAVLVSDTGWSAIWSSTLIRMKPGQMYTRCAGTLGWSFPAAIGAKCGVPDRPVVCFAGDGAFQYFYTELETAVRNGINVVTVVNNNRTYGQVLSSVVPGMYRDDMERGAKRISFAPVDFAAVANAIGAYGIRVEKHEDIVPAIQKALAAGRPAVIDVITDPNGWVLPNR